MLEELKESVYRANLELVKSGLVVLTWGNVSGKDEKTGYIAIKPSGVPYDEMRVDDIVIVDAEGNVIEGSLRPSSDLPTHLYLYKAYPDILGVVHTHSEYATAFAQSGREIVAYGTTHADAFYGNIPITRALKKDEIENSYEENTGKVITETVSDPLAMPGVLVKNHGVFTFARSPKLAVEYALTLEAVAKMAYLTEQIEPGCRGVDQALLDKHYLRKHGKNAYYGQK